MKPTKLILAGLLALALTVFFSSCSESSSDSSESGSSSGNATVDSGENPFLGTLWYRTVTVGSYTATNADWGTITFSSSEKTASLTSPDGSASHYYAVTESNGAWTADFHDDLDDEPYVTRFVISSKDAETGVFTIIDETGRADMTYTRQ